MSHKTDATLRPFLFAFSHCVPSGRFSRRCNATPQNDIKCVARNRIKRACKVFYCFSANKTFLRSVRSTMSLRAQRGNLPEGYPCYNPTQDTFVLAWRKGANGLLFCFYCILIFLLLYKQKNFLKMFVFCFTKPFLYGIIHS